MESQILFLNQALLDFDYPNIHAYEDDEVFKVFDTKNRRYLLSWLYHKFSNNDNHDVESDEVLEDFLSSYGFSRGEKSKKFISCEMEISDQFGLLYKIFKFLKSVRNVDKKVDSEFVSNEKLINFFKTDVNIFKQYGSMNINELKSPKFSAEIDLCMKNKIDLVSDLKTAPSKSEKSQTNELKSLSENVLSLKAKFSDLMKTNCEEESTFKVDEGSFKNLAESVNNCLKLRKYKDDIDVIQRFSEVEDVDRNLEKNDEFSEMIEVIYNKVKKLNE